MSTIYAVYEREPAFPATDQSPAATRYQVGSYWIDAVGGEPTQDEVDAIISPSAPSWPSLDFLARFTQSELEAIATAARSSAALAVWMARAGSAVTVYSDNADTIAGTQALVDAGLLTSDRRDQILSSGTSP